MMTKKIEEELKATINLLSERGLPITKRNISLYGNPQVLTGSIITGLTSEEFKHFLPVKSSNKLSEVTNSKGEKIPFAFIAAKKKEHEEKLSAFIDIIDMMVEDNIELSNKNINEMGKGIFSSSYLSYGEQAEYLRQKREETGYKNVKKVAEKVVKKETPEEINSITILFNGETLSDFDRDYIRDALDTIKDESQDYITVDALIDIFAEGGVVNFPKEVIEKDCEIMEYIDSINKEKRICKITSMINQELKKMEKEGLKINRFTLLNRCSKFLDYDMIKSNAVINEIFINL